jgi:protein phosphatase PTC2/3
MIPHRRSKNLQISSPESLLRDSSLNNPSFLSNIHRALSLSSTHLPKLSGRSDALISSPKLSPAMSPVQPLSPSPSQAGRLPSLPALSSTVKSSRHHGIIKAYCANTHRGLVKKTNEDRVMIISRVVKPAAKSCEQWPRCSFFAVYDGHGGKECCNFLRDNLHNYIISDNCFPDDPAQAILNGFKATEEEFLDFSMKYKNRSGSCAVVLLIMGKTGFLANLGDSRCIISECESNKITQISMDHKPHYENESVRIKKAGGTIVFNRNSNVSKQLISRILPIGLAVSRSFGDLDAKVSELGGLPNAIIAVPDVKVFKIHSDADFILLASDGMFDKFENTEVVESFRKAVEMSGEEEIENKLSKGVESVMIEAMIKNSMDNITLVAIAFENFTKTLV